MLQWQERDTSTTSGGYLPEGVYGTGGSEWGSALGHSKQWIKVLVLVIVHGVHSNPGWGGGVKYQRRVRNALGWCYERMHSNTNAGRPKANKYTPFRWDVEVSGWIIK